MDKKTEILDAAFRLFSASGYHLSMADLAAAVGIRTPSLYSHFAGKEEIVGSVVLREIDSYFDQYQRQLDLLETADCRERFRSLFFAVLAYFRQEGRLRFWKNIPLIPQDALRSRCTKRIEERGSVCRRTIERWFQEGIGACAIRSSAGEGTVPLYAIMTQGVLDALLLSGTDPADVDAHASRVFEAFWQGVDKDTGGNGT